MSKRGSSKVIAPGTGSGGSPVNPEPSHAVEGEEWTWMVDEDPAFYLEETGRAPDKRAGQSVAPVTDRHRDPVHTERVIARTG